MCQQCCRIAPVLGRDRLFLLQRRSRLFLRGGGFHVDRLPKGDNYFPNYVEGFPFVLIPASSSKVSSNIQNMYSTGQKYGLTFFRFLKLL